MFWIFELIFDSYCTEEYHKRKRKEFCEKFRRDNFLDSMSYENMQNAIEVNQEELYKRGISINEAFEYLCLPALKNYSSSLDEDSSERVKEEKFSIFKVRFNSPKLNNSFVGNSFQGNESASILLGMGISLTIILLVIFVPKYRSALETIHLNLAEPEVHSGFISNSEVQSYKLKDTNSSEYLGIVFRCDPKTKKGFARTIRKDLEFHLENCADLLDRVNKLKAKEIVSFPLILNSFRGKVSYKL